MVLLEGSVPLLTTGEDHVEITGHIACWSMLEHAGYCAFSNYPAPTP